MLNKKMWNIFKKTGNIEAYLYCKEYKDYIKSKEEDVNVSEIQLLQSVQTNTLY
ncbi:YqzL family protein [Clostridium formicaceticum]|uniref:YqzL family protein n=2 Tax=Clostridium formicaceticum TaxID=1497 RepID=A0AAC9WHW0_9CLOT|nr:YqzL family protein [Clostridium formicaceticum]ARE88125.1 hypothetical protein CLFO_25260 [Clostridium formicaceticum]